MFILLCIPNLVVDDDLDDDPTGVLNSFAVHPDIDVANVVFDANLEMEGSELVHSCKSWSRH